jgi:hypothetical protein
LEEFVVSIAKKVIPQSVRDKYNEYRAAWKGEDHAHAGGDRAGWGVEEAEERNKSEASTLSNTHKSRAPLFCSFAQRRNTVIYFITRGSTTYR